MVGSLRITNTDRLDIPSESCDDVLMNNRELVIVILPTSYLWLLTSLFLLLYAFDILEIVFETQTQLEILNPGIIVLFTTACLATATLFLSGYIIDKSPQLTKAAILVSLFMSSISLSGIALGAYFPFLLIIALPLLGIFLGTLASASGAAFAAYSDVSLRGRIYAFSIFLSAAVALFILLLSSFMSLFPSYPLVMISAIGILYFIFVFLNSKSIFPWKNDPFPTSIFKIINRRSVQAYLTAQFFIYLMLGIVFVTIPQIGSYRHPMVSLGGFSLDQRIVFWGLVFLGDLITVIPAGIIADRVGRKNLIVVGAYLIVVSTLNLGLSEDIWMFLFSAYILGISFGLIHPAASVWCDLSPLDSIGRYMALNYVSLLQGIGVGLFLGLFALPRNNASTISYILIGVTVLALLPLFFVADSYQPLDIFLLLLSINGMACFDYAFKKDKEVTQKDLSLVAGALSAISTFFESVDKQHATLDLVRHGNVFVVQTKARTKSGELVGTLFANKNDPELYRHLKEFVGSFCKQYSDPLMNWQGELRVFRGASEIAEEVFGPLLPSRTAS